MSRAWITTIVKTKYKAKFSQRLLEMEKKTLKMYSHGSQIRLNQHVWDEIKFPLRDASKCKKNLLGFAISCSLRQRANCHSRR